MTNNGQDNPRMLDDVVRRLVEGLHPERIYLFGSRARGDSADESDYDFLVVVKSSRESGVHACQKGHALLAGLGIAKDVIVLGKSEFDRFSDVVGTLPEIALREGRLLYAT